MANTRTRFDAIVAYLGKAHDAHELSVRGRPCIGIEGATFIALHRDGLGFRLHGRALRHTLSLPGARAWHPLDPERTAPDWVLVPSVHAWRWDRIAIEAYRCATSAVVSATAKATQTEIGALTDPPRSTGASLARRVAAAIARRFAGINLARAA